MGKKILLAEDSLTIQKVFELTFRGTDVALTMVDNGDDAVRLAGEIAPDLVITDVTLPGKDGFEVASSLRQEERTKSIPVLVLAGTVAPFDENRFRKCGADGVVFKPFESQEMVDRINGYLRGGATARPVEKAGAPPKASEETWDFSDVIEEVEDESSRPAPVPVAAPPRPEDLLGDVVAPAPVGKGPATLNEFDVSLEDLEGPPAEVPAGPSPPLQEISRSFDEALEERKEEPAPPVEFGAPPPSLDLHIEGDLFQDSPQPVTDLSAALESVESAADLEIEEELAALGKEFAPPAATPAPPVAPPPPPAPPAVREAAKKAEAIPRPMGTIPPPAVPPPPTAARPVPPPPAAAVAVPPPAPPPEPAGSPDPLKEAFDARIREIVEKAAAETVERVLWDAVDRWSEEFSARIRETVETVAWEVIPQAAETVIREEISRIRGQSGKKSS